MKTIQQAMELKARIAELMEESRKNGSIYGVRFEGENEDRGLPEMMNRMVIAAMDGQLPTTSSVEKS